MVVIVDAGLGNIASVLNMLSFVGIDGTLRSSPEGVSADNRFILPGVGSFDEGVRRLHESGWFEYLQNLPASTHILGICLGMQLLGTSSEEGQLFGLNRITAEFRRFDQSSVRVPHIGWNTVEFVSDDPMFADLPATPRFYFTHSYRAICGTDSIELGRTNYGASFTSVYRSGNTRGVQFHPEKSHRFGMKLLKNWSTLAC